jgi:uncharacterized protein (TIGR04255 family)
MPDWDPLTGKIPKEVPLQNAPLVRVIAQVRFPTIASVERADTLAPFQEALRGRYPFLRQERGQNFTITPGGIQAGEPALIWRFSASGEPSDTGWTVALTKDFVALEAIRYTSRDDFMARLAEVLSALNETFHPPAMDRLGIRYIDRLQGDDVAKLAEFIHADALGLIASPVGRHIQGLAFTEALLSIESGTIRGRWVRLPPQSTFDPAAIAPIAIDSWVLDLDAFTEEKLDFDVARIVDRARLFAERIYSVFRWSVTDEFLRHFGGKP